MDKDNINYLLTAKPEDFDLLSAVDAVLELSDSLEDILFQINDVPEEEFQGLNYKQWKMKATYKKNIISSALRRFRARVQELRIK